MNIEKIYVINLKKSNEDIIERMGNLGLGNRAGYEIFVAIDGNNIPHDIEPFAAYSGWKLDNSTNDWWNRQVLPGEIGCTLSHMEIWKKVAEGEEDIVLVLEEDFESVNPLHSLNIDGIPSWDFMYLGRNALDKESEISLNDQFCVPLNSYCSHAYVITKMGALKLLNYVNLRSNIIPVDEFLPTTFTTHPRKDINELFSEKNIRAVATKEDWIKQTSNSETSSIGHGNPEKEQYFEILDDSNWDAWKAKYLNHTMAKGEYDLMVDDLGHNVFEFQLFTEKFCKEAIALAEAKDNWTVDRHEFYPTNDVLLQEIGLQNIYNRVLREVVYPLCIHLWTLEGKGWRSMSSENFLARYTTDRQSHLSLHHDFSHITMVVKLNDEFDGGGTWFPKYNLLSNPERVGTATLHPGLVTHLHGARPIYSGKRYICVSFMRKTNDNI